MAIKVVFCYAHEDEKLLEQLKAHLKPLEREQLIEMWSDRDISAGEAWKQKINEKLDTAHIILLLISPDFMNSDYCYSTEMQRTLELHNQGKVRAIPVILRPVFWKGGALRELQALPTDGDPVTNSQRWRTLDDAFFNVTQGICLVLQHLASQEATSKLLAPDLLPKLERHGLLIKKVEPTREKYCTALYQDARISKIQIMSMSKPLDITNIYVRVRLHEEVGREFDVDPLLRTAGRRRDPNILLEAKREWLKLRTGEALDPDAAIRKYPHCVIVGDPGAGKTTLLKYLALKSVEGTLANLPAIPIHVELNAFVNYKSDNLLEFAAETWDERYGFSKDAALTFMQNELITGRAMLLLDALDETVIGENSQDAEASYKRVADTIAALATRFHRAPIVVTARKAGYQLREPLAGFTELEVLDFSFDDIKRFITNWFGSTPPKGSFNKAANLIAKLEKTLRMQELATNPLLLSLIVLVYESQLDLPERRAELYKRCIDILLTDWDSKRHIIRRREFQPQHKRQLLEEIAWHFHRQGVRYFPERELLEIIANFLPAVGLLSEDNKHILEEIANENGILKEQAQTWYGFIHMTLQEYCAAQYLTDHGELNTLMQYVDDPRWEEVTLLYAGQAPDASPLLERLLGKHASSPSEDIFHNNLIMAGRCLAGRPTIRHAALREEILSNLLALLKTTPYSLTRKQVIETLLGLDDPKVNKRLLESLNDQQFYGRSDVIEQLWVLGKQTLESELLCMIKNEQCRPEVRCTLIEKMPGETRENAVSDLMLLLHDKQCHSSVREIIASRFRYIRDVNVAPELWDILKSEPSNTIVYCHIMIALVSLGETVSASDLLFFLTNNVSNSPTWSVCDALMKLRDKTVIPNLLDILQDSHTNSYIREEVIRVITSLDTSTATLKLLDLLKDEQFDFSLRKRIVTYLIIYGKSLTPDLLSLLSYKRSDLSIRNHIAGCLGQWGPDEMIPELLNLLKNKQVDASIRNHIVLGLAEQRLVKIVPELLDILKNEHRGTSIYNNLILALTLAREPGVMPDFLRLLKEKQYTDSLIVSYAVRNLNEQKYVSDLLFLLTDKDLGFWLRGAIAETLEGLIDDEETTAQLASYAPRLSIDNNIYSSLWRLSRRTGVKIPLRK